MSDVVISVEHLTKEYRIGAITHRTFQRDLQSWWARVRGRDDPNLPVDGGRRKKLEQFADENGIIHALKDVSFEVRQGEVLGIIGKNGAGKSTLLKILSRVTAPTSGCVKIKGRIGSLLEVGTGFHPELTGRENIYMNGVILGMKKLEIDRKLDEIIDFSGVEQFIDTPVKRYSSGMYVRLAFAVAAHLDPEILVVDEVLAVGDAEFQKKCLGKMGDVSKKEGRTVLFVSHNMAAVSQLCSKSLLLTNGFSSEKDETRHVLDSYLFSTQKSLSGRVSWDDLSSAPGDNLIKIGQVEIVQNDRLSPVIDINLPFKVKIRFHVLQEVKNLISGISFYDTIGTCLFNSCNWKENMLPQGTYLIEVTVPKCVFAEGRVNLLVQLVFYDPSILSVVLPDVISFECVDSPSFDSVRGLYKLPWPGIVRIGLNWGGYCRVD